MMMMMITGAKGDLAQVGDGVGGFRFGKLKLALSSPLCAIVGPHRVLTQRNE